MLTLHRGAVDAVLVQDDRIAALGPAGELAAAHPGARVRDWPGGRITGGLVEPAAVELLERRYHPDPREGIGTAPRELPAGLSDPALGGSARRGLQALLARGVTAVVGPFTLPVVRTAVARSGLAVLAADAPFDREPAGTSQPPPAFGRGDPHGWGMIGGRADFAVFGPIGAADERCLATVLAGRIVFRGRS
ncbi:imidazolonepropionase-like domain-containing protein [Kitasatospora acidiphila]|uniref:imidazolonepropionase-like domain-containing protein n=1 Tax=Kitasatospora acidiphila TaxID=2567942 RepID=UPI003C72D391